MADPNEVKAPARPALEPIDRRRSRRPLGDKYIALYVWLFLVVLFVTLAVVFRGNDGLIATVIDALKNMMFTVFGMLMNGLNTGFQMMRQSFEEKHGGSGAKVQTEIQK